jgi:lysophospholipid acyltransferase (LPLAT)-like uncharacterized protein
MIKRITDWLLLNVATLLATGVIRLLYATLRIDFVGEEHVKTEWTQNRPVILSFWHDQLLLMVKGYRGPGARILISASKDGELIARVMAYFGQGAVRGSSSRGAKAALKQMIGLGKEPYDLVFTPDGPRGPRHVIKPGVGQLARLTGRPVIPMAFACSRGHRFASWDRFLLPFPFCRAVYAFGPPLLFDKSEDVDTFCARLQQAMNENTQRASTRLEAFGVFPI